MPWKVLLIDDDREFLDILSERLEFRDMEVATASSAMDAIALVEKNTYDTIILDLQMPQIDGLQALEKLRQVNPALQIIVLTGHATVAKGVQAMKLGAVDVMEKPVDIRLLVDKIKTTASGQGGQPAQTAASPPAAKPRGLLSTLLRPIRDAFGAKDDQ